jgi:mycothiol synthase
VDSAAWVALYNDTFAHDWGFRPWTVDEYRHWQSAPYYRADGDLIAVGADGTPVALCLCQIDPAAIRRRGRNEGAVVLLGTRPGHRRRGLGRAMLLAGLHWLHGAGIDRAVVTVDVENATGALRLYESCAFVQYDGQVVYQRDVPR